MRMKDLQTTLAICLQRRENVLIVGQPGIGKSDAGVQAAADLGYDYVATQPALSDPTDYKGAPWVLDGAAAFLPFPEMQRLIGATRPLLLAIEDLGQAPPLVQASLMHLLLAREVGGQRISDEVRFVATTNRKQDKAGVAGLLEPVKSRFATIVQLDFDLDDWTKWALGAGIPTPVVAFARMRGCGTESQPGLFDSWEASAAIENSVTPRTMAAAGRFVSYGLPVEIEQEVIAGAIGKGPAAELIGFLQIYRALPNPDGILINPTGSPVPSDPHVQFALAGVIAHRTTPGNASAAFAYIGRLPEDIQSCVVRMITQKTPAVMSTAAFIGWAAAHQDINL